MWIALQELGRRFRRGNAFRWVFTAYFAQGVPFAMVLGLAATLLSNLGYRPERTTPILGTISVAWSLKPLYAGFLPLVCSVRRWVILTQFAMALLLLSLAGVVRLDEPLWPSAAGFALLAMTSATHDIAVDGVYVTELDEDSRSRWAGVCGAAWNAGRLFAVAGIVAIASGLQRAHVEPRNAWSVALIVAAAAMAVLAWHHAGSLPRASTSPPVPERAAPGGLSDDLTAQPGLPGTTEDVGREALAAIVPKMPFAPRITQAMAEFVQQWRDLFVRPGIGRMLFFVLCYRLSEGFLLLEVPLYLQSDTTTGGLGFCAADTLSRGCPFFLSDKAWLDGGLATVTSAVFGILGGRYLDRVKLTRRSLLFMAGCLNVPHLALVILSQLAQARVTISFSTIAALTLLEKAGYSFGFVANMVYLMQQTARGRYPVAHYAIGTAVMQLALVPTQAFSGPLAAWLGYPKYFLFASLAAIPSILGAALAPIPQNGGSSLVGPRTILPNALPPQGQSTPVTPSLAPGTDEL